jgi:hypothetical protein
MTRRWYSYGRDVTGRIGANCVLPLHEYLVLPLRLMPWQRDCINELYACDAKGSLRYRWSLFGIPKKRGKSTMIAALALYDDVPGGAGLAREAYARAREVFESALQVCNECTCGEHSSCYGCLRSYRNQDFHHLLDRTLAAKVLADLLSRGSAGA